MRSPSQQQIAAGLGDQLQLVAVDQRGKHFDRIEARFRPSDWQALQQEGCASSDNPELLQVTTLEQFWAVFGRNLNNKQRSELARKSGVLHRTQQQKQKCVHTHIHGK